MKLTSLLLCCAFLLCFTLLQLSLRTDFSVTVLDIRPEAEEAAASSVIAPVFPLDINRVTREDLTWIPGIGDVLSSRIVQYREHLGGYTELAQLTEIKGISENLAETLSEYLYIDPSNSIAGGDLP